MKRLLTALLVGAIRISLLTACSEQTPSADNEEDNIATGNLTNEQNISSFTLDENAEKIEAYSIYTNWN